GGSDGQSGAGGGGAQGGSAGSDTGGSGGDSAGGGAAGTSGNGGGAGDGGASKPGVNVLTRSYDDQRTGSNLSETILNTSNVNRTGFAKLFELPVDDQVYAQILYVSDLSIGGKSHNVIFAATVNNTVYAFDADAPGDFLWRSNFNGAGRPSARTDV